MSFINFEEIFPYVENLFESVESHIESDNENSQVGGPLPCCSKWKPHSRRNPICKANCLYPTPYYVLSLIPKTFSSREIGNYIMPTFDNIL